MNQLKFPTDPKVWGPGVWYCIHTIALNSRDIRSDQRTVQIIIENIPCSKCREHALNFLEKNPFREVGLNSSDFFRWTVELHNKCNKWLNKPQLTVQEARNIYLNTRVCEDCDDKPKPVVYRTNYRTNRVSRF